MSADTADDDPLGERVANIEGTVEQMDKRLDSHENRMDERFSTLDGKIDGHFETLDGKMDDRFNQLETRIDERFQAQEQRIRRWMYLMLFALSVAVAVITFLIQFLM